MLPVPTHAPAQFRAALKWGNHSGNYLLHLVSGISRRELRRKMCNYHPGLHYLPSLFGLQTKVQAFWLLLLSLPCAQQDMAGMGMACLLPKFLQSRPRVSGTEPLAPAHCHLLWDRVLAGDPRGCGQALKGQGADGPLGEPGSVAISSRWHPPCQVTPS